MCVGRFASVAWIVSVFCSPVLAALTGAQVLVVFNSKSTDATTVLNAYLAAHPDIPGVNVLDLNSTAIANRADISYAEFVTHIRTPIRNYLDLAGDPTPEGIVSICLIRGLPHRIQDTDNPAVGDYPNDFVNEFNAGDTTCASVDSELVLLWQNLEAGEAGNGMDSKSDNLIDNPYHASLSEIQTFNRSKIKVTKTFTQLPGGLAWQIGGNTQYKLTPGDMYLVSRIDGATAATAIAIIGRAANLHVNRRYGWVILDEDAINTFDDDDYGGLFGSAPDYENTRDHLTAAGFNVLYDKTAAFTTAATFPRPVIAYASYGENHNPNPAGSGIYIEGFYFPPGAIFNTTESYNGRAFNGLGTKFYQEQIADFLSAGGTFGVGYVWEPLTISLVDNDYLLGAMLSRGMTWAEAAWTAIPALSWMHIVVGDPLARVVQVIDQPADFDADADVDSSDVQYLLDCATGPAMGPPTPACADADLDNDGLVDMVDFAALQRCLSSSPSTLNPNCAN